MSRFVSENQVPETKQKNLKVLNGKIRIFSLALFVYGKVIKYWIECRCHIFALAHSHELNIIWWLLSWRLSPGERKVQTEITSKSKHNEKQIQNSEKCWHKKKRKIAAYLFLASTFNFFFFRRTKANNMLNDCRYFFVIALLSYGNTTSALFHLKFVVKIVNNFFFILYNRRSFRSISVNNIVDICWSKESH